MSFKIPLFDLNFDQKEEDAVLAVLQSKWISMGPKVREFENLFSEMLCVKNAIATSNCTVALHLALRLIGLDVEDEVICPSLTFVATANAVKYVGAKPVFADVRSYHDLTIDPDEILSKITRRTKAIIVMHYGGFACEMDKIMAIAKDHNLKVIEDASHAPIAEYNGAKLGTIGDIGCFSFFSNKNISTGEGGMLVTNNQEYAERARLLRSHGMTSMSYERAKGHSSEYDVVDLGYNFRLDDIRAAIGLVQLNKIEDDIKKRAEVRKIYVESLQKNDKVIIPFVGVNHFSSNYIFPILLRSSSFKYRDSIRTSLAKKGIQTSVHYPAVHKFSIYKNPENELPVTEYCSDNIITLPMYAAISNDQSTYITDTINRIIYE